MAHVYFLGIGGTLMGSLAQIAKQLGHSVSGSDQAVYPPMSDQLANAGITVHEGFQPAQFDPLPDQIVVGNAQLPRGHPAIEYILEHNLAFTSGAQWLGETVLRDRWVIAVSGTHGKTTTASMIAWILEYAEMQPSFLIGGVPGNFGVSSRLSDTPFFVVEADEYDTSYFDRRSKFVHYRPRTLVINNLEYDHADIFPDLAAIQTQFHHLVRTVPATGLIVAPTQTPAIDEVLDMGCWTPVERFGDPKIRHRGPHIQDNGHLWQARNATPDASGFDVVLDNTEQKRLEWPLIGQHNISNALAAIAAARHVGVPAEVAIDALAGFKGVKRRMELIIERDGVSYYDDFAHHPSAIRTTLQGLRKRVGSARILAVVEPRTHTMSLGALRHDLASCCAAADEVIWYRGPNIKWDLNELVSECVVPSSLEDNIDALVDRLTTDQPNPGHVLIMSNGSFGGLYEKLRKRLG